MVSLIEEYMGFLGRDNYLSVRVIVDLRKPLCVGFFLDRGAYSPLRIQNKCEKMGSFCYICSFLGHAEGGCSRTNRVKVVVSHLPEVPMFSIWMRAEAPFKSCFEGLEQLIGKRQVSGGDRVDGKLEDQWKNASKNVIEDENLRRWRRECGEH